MQDATVPAPDTDTDTDTDPGGAATAEDPTNPLLRRSTLPYGLPDFASVTPALLREALEEGMAREAAAWQRIIDTPEVADVANTIEALGRAGVELDRAATLMHTFAGSVGTQDYQDLETEFTPLLAAHADEFWLSLPMYRRYRSIERAQPLLDLLPDVAHHVSTTARRFRLGGIELDDVQREQLRELNTHLAALESDFGSRVTRASENGGVDVTDRAELAGLDEDTIAALLVDDDARADHGRDDVVAHVSLINTSQQPLAARSDSAALRSRLFAASTSRCGQSPLGQNHVGQAAEPAPVPDEFDTRATLLEIARLRATRAHLLGHRDHASVVAAANDAGTTERIDDLLGRIAGPAMARADAEIAQLRDAAGGTEPTAADLTRLYAERRRSVAQVDDEALRPYLELTSVVERGMFHAAHLLYGLSFTERTDLAGYTDDVRVWEVFDADGSGLGLFVGDFYHRPGKRGGAWMHALVSQSHLLGDRPVICNNSNFRKPRAGAPTLLTWDEVRTCFHEFGHALHGLLSDVHLPQQSGTSVQRDTVEFPSQVNEYWQSHPTVLANYARHHVTGEPLPAHLVEKIALADEVDAGFSTVEHAAAVMLDQAWHRMAAEEVPTEPAEVDVIEQRALEAMGLAHPLIPPRYRSSYFRHTFGGGYDAGYYSYLWAEQLDADTVEWFRTVAARGDDRGLNRGAGDRFRREVLSRGGTRDMSDSFHALRGRDVRAEPLLARRGLLAD